MRLPKEPLYKGTQAVVGCTMEHRVVVRACHIAGSTGMHCKFLHRFVPCIQQKMCAGLQPAGPQLSALLVGWKVVAVGTVGCREFSSCFVLVLDRGRLSSTVNGT